MTDRDFIDRPKRTMNQPTELFNNNNPPPAQHVVQRVQAPSAPSSPLVAERPRIRRTFGSTPEEIRAETPTQIVDTSVFTARKQLTGSFAAVRAARTLHQYLVDFWDSAGVIDTVVGQVEADPTQDQLDQMYDDFLLFSYLPSVMTPSKPTFIDMATPSKRAAVVQADLPNMGINTKVAQTQSDTTIQDQEVIVIIALPTPPPYAERLTSFCNGREIFKLDNNA